MCSSDLSTKAVTTESDPAVGNAAITGTFTAQTFVISNSAGSYTISPTIYTSVNVTSAGVLTVIDSYILADFRTAEYVASVNDNTANNKYASKLLVTHDGTTSYMSEYGIMISNSNIGTFSTSTNTTHVKLEFTGVSACNTIKLSRVIV